MDIEKQIKLEKIYRKRRIVIKGILALFLLIGITYSFNHYIPKEIYSILGYVFLGLFLTLQIRLSFIIRKIPPLLCNSPSFTGEQHLLTLYKSVIVGFVFTLCLTVFFLVLSDYTLQLTIEFVCSTIILSAVLSLFAAFLLLDKKDRKKAKLAIENKS